MRVTLTSLTVGEVLLLYLWAYFSSLKREKCRWKGVRQEVRYLANVL